ncbi:MAG: hypothetical protein ABIO16_18000 [Nocardioides sp.]
MELLLVWLFGLLAVFSSFSASASVTESEPAAEPTAAAVPEANGAQQLFIEREPLPSCGSYVAGPGDHASPDLHTGWRCLEQSAGGRGGEMVVYSEHESGVPVYRYLRVTPLGQVEVFTQEVGRVGVPWSYEACSLEVASWRQGCP